MAGENSERSCKSIFRSGEASPTREAITRAWAALIRQLERGKASRRGDA
ncbi:MAG: hypothetical protein LUH51_02415 [Firmicutes bacterium]|nr:hypothetical protein [Bacillota bacterium]